MELSNSLGTWAQLHYQRYGTCHGLYFCYTEQSSKLPFTHSKLATILSDISQSQFILRQILKSESSAHPKLESEITLEFTIRFQNLPFYEVKLNLSPFKCTQCGSDWPLFDTSKVENEKDSTQSETSVLPNLGAHLYL